MAHSDKQYRDAALAMLPNGPAWNRAAGSVMYSVMWAIGACMTVLENDLSQIALETRIPFADQLLPEWEADYNIPTDPTLSVEERRLNILKKSRKKQFPSISGLIQLAAEIGYTIEIVRHLPFCCGDPKSQCGIDNREIGVTRSVLGIIVLSSTGILTLTEFTKYMQSFLPAHVELGVTVANG